MEQLLPKQVGNKNSKLLTTAMLISKLHPNHFMLVCQYIFDEAVLCHLPAVPSRVWPQSRRKNSASFPESSTYFSIGYCNKSKCGNNFHRYSLRESLFAKNAGQQKDNRPSKLQPIQ